MARYKYEVGDFVLTDQFICKTLGRFPIDYGHESLYLRFQGGNIHNHAELNLIQVENQVLIGTNEIVICKKRFEKWLYEQFQ